MNYSALITAAGKGLRSGLSYNKVLYKIHDKMILEYSIDFFLDHAKCTEIIVICNREDEPFLTNFYKEKNIMFVVGGETRQMSVMNGISASSNDYVLIHDAARPFINMNVVNKLLIEVEKHHACSVAVPSKNTLVSVNDDGFYDKIEDREKVWQVQTPQAFKKELILNAHKKALEAGLSASDDTGLIARFTSTKPKYILGDERSIKLTTPYDIQLLEVILWLGLDIVQTSTN